jgi:hypothetical protein
MILALVLQELWPSSPTFTPTLNPLQGDAGKRLGGDHYHGNTVKNENGVILMFVSDLW